VRAQRVILATGAIERPLVFGDNDRPGIMLASAVSAFVNRYAVRPGERAVVFTNNDGAYRTALDLADASVAVQAVIDLRPQAKGALPGMVRARGIRVLEGAAIAAVKGKKRVRGIEVMRVAGEGLTGAPERLACDLVAVSGGWNPAVHLHAQSGGKARFDETLACFVPGVPVQAECSAGACNGRFALADCLTEGFAAGAEAAARAGFGDGEVPPTPPTSGIPEEPLLPVWLVPARERPGRGTKQFVDLQNDVTAADIMLAAREGFHSVEHVKRYTALGFGTDQGKLGNINGVGILARTLGQDIPSTGTTTFRPNYTPVTFGAIAGRDLGALFDPIRKAALHQWHEEHGALFENVGQWKRPWYYPKPGETMREAVDRECLAVRNGVGIMDASTLGKIDIQGPDAAEFLNRVYTNAWSKLEVGRCRYGLMLKEDGMVFDDGVTSRLGPNHFLMTTTTGGAATVLTWLERWLQTEWPDLKVRLTSVTDHWATAAVVGPRSRDVLRKVCDDIDFSADAFPFLSWRAGTVAGVPARVFRISFSGELAYEVNVDANCGRHVWETLMAAGAEYGITPYGTETMHVLRAEKGYIIVGQDTDGSQTPHDLGMSWIVKKKGDFIGRRSLSRSDMLRADRKQLVGLLTADGAEVLPEGSQLVDAPGEAWPIPMVGHITSSYHSANLGRSIALALVKGGLKRMGETVQALLRDGRAVPAVITSPVFLDAEGTRQNPPAPPADAEARGATIVVADPPRLESPLVGSRLADRARAGGSGPGVEACERPFLGHINLRGDASDPAFVAAVAGATGAEPPTTPNTWVAAGDLRLFWLGPDEWLIVTLRERKAAVADALRRALADLHTAVTVVSGGQTVVGIGGPRAADLLAKGCTLDLHPRTFGEDRCAQTLFAKAPVLIRRLPGGQGFELVVRRSFADYLWLWLEDAAAEYGLRVREPSPESAALAAE
jgi:sarcosine oxidase subunit alpha